MAAHLQLNGVVSVDEFPAGQEQDRVMEVMVLQDDLPGGPIAEGPLVEGQTCYATVDGHLRLDLQLVRPIHLQ